jgi:hypothetical protein
MKETDVFSYSDVKFYYSKYVAYTRIDQIRNEDIRNKLGISPLNEKNNKIQQ